METCVITIKPRIQIVDIGNECEAYSASIYIPAKSELKTTMQSIMQFQLFLDYNFNYTNVSIGSKTTNGKTTNNYTCTILYISSGTIAMNFN